jgi:predicted nucleic acid-binding protein
MKHVFVDSGGFFAHLVADDAEHEAARHCFQRARAQNWALVTTNAVIFEAYALLLNRAREGRSLAIGLLDDVDAGMCHVERATKRDETRAIDLVRTYEDKSHSLCDALSFVVMERLGIQSAIAFDRHFRQYGRFEIL